MKQILSLFILALVIGISLIMTHLSMMPRARAEFDFAQISQHLTMLLFLSLVIERATEVFLTLRFDPIQIPAVSAAAMREKRLAQLTYALDPSRGATEFTHPDHENLVNELNQLRDEYLPKMRHLNTLMEDLKHRKVMTAACVSLAASGALALAGVSAVGALFEPGLPPMAWPAMGLQITDVALTTLLLAGGAKGVHHILRKFDRPMPQVA